MQGEADDEAAAVATFVRSEVEDWDDDAKSRARFKALSGQRSDWEPLYRFWRDLIVKVARHLHIFIISPSRVKRLWFTRSGLSPLCLDRVLIEMHRAGDLLSPQPHPTSATATLSHYLRRALDVLGATNQDNRALSGDSYLVTPLLQEHALELVNKLSENHWTNSCVITMRKFEEISKGSDDALAILGCLSSHGKARRFTVNAGAVCIEGVKVCLSPGAVSIISSIDSTVLHLVWTTEKLEQQISLIDQRYQKSRSFAVASLRSGNRRNALRYVKELKLASQSRERCVALLDRVERVLHVITDAESSKQVFEAIQSSTHALQEKQISVQEVELCLQEVDENIDSLKQLDDALGSISAHGEIDDEDIENEFNQLQLETECGFSQAPTETGFEISVGSEKIMENADALTIAMSNLNINDGGGTGLTKPEGRSRECNLEVG